MANQDLKDNMVYQKPRSRATPRAIAKAEHPPKIPNVRNEWLTHQRDFTGIAETFRQGTLVVANTSLLGLLLHYVANFLPRHLPRSPWKRRTKVHGELNVGLANVRDVLLATVIDPGERLQRRAEAHSALTSSSARRACWRALKECLELLAATRV